MNQWVATAALAMGTESGIPTQEPLLWFSQKISAVSDTACGSEPCLCPEQSAASRPLLEQGLLRQLRHSLNPLLSSPGRHCHGNQTLAGHCQQANVGFTKSVLLFISPFSNEKSKPCSGSCVWFQWYLSVLAVVLHRQWMSTPARWRAGKLPPSIQTLCPGKFSGFSCLFGEDGTGKGQVLPCFPKLKWPTASSSLLIIPVTRTNPLTPAPSRGCQSPPSSFLSAVTCIHTHWIQSFLIFTNLPPWVAFPTSSKCSGDVYCPKSCARHDQVLAHSTYLQHACALAVLQVREGGSTSTFSLLLSLSPALQAVLGAQLELALCRAMRADGEPCASCSSCGLPLHLQPGPLYSI